jgi:hypothetical protein
MSTLGVLDRDPLVINKPMAALERRTTTRRSAQGERWADGERAQRKKP